MKSLNHQDLGPLHQQSERWHKGGKRTSIAHTDKQAPLKRRKYIAASSSDSDDEPLSMQFQRLKPAVGMKSSPDSTSELQGSTKKKRRVLVKAKDIIDTTVAEETVVQSNPDEGANADKSTNTDGLINPDESVFLEEPIISLASAESSGTPSPRIIHVDMSWETAHTIA